MPDSPPASVLWGVGGSLQSGTFEAWLYDELAARSSSSAYARLNGYATTASEACALIGILTAAPLFAWGGYQLVGWVSVGVATGQAVLAGALPAAPKVVSAATIADLDEDDSSPPPIEDIGASSAVGTYVSMLRSGTSEALRHPTVRGGVLLFAALFGFTALDEYFGLIAGENGSSTATIPLLVGLTVAGSLVGSLLAGRTATMHSSTMVWALVVAGATLGVGSLLGGPGVIGSVGFALLGVGYGIVTNTAIVTEARLQAAIEGPARATVTSASALLSEAVALAIFGAVALGSIWLPLSATMALLAVPVVMIAALVPRWLPDRPARDPR